MTRAERERRRRESILDMYRKNYARPFWEAYKAGNSHKIDKMCSMGYCFKLGVYMAKPYSKYYEAFNRIDKELKKEIVGDDG